jgi:hypothetical protein
MCFKSVVIPPIIIPPPPSFNFGCYKIGDFLATAHYDFCLAVGGFGLGITTGGGVDPQSPNFPTLEEWNQRLSDLEEELNEANAACGGGLPRASASVKYPFKDSSGNCEPVFELDIGIPCIPIKIKKGNPTWQAMKPPAGPGPAKPPNKNTLTAKGGRKETYSPDGIQVSCEYEFKLGGTFNCPEFIENSPPLTSVIAMDVDGDFGQAFMKIKVQSSHTDDRCGFKLTPVLYGGITEAYTVVCDVTRDGSGDIFVWDKTLYFKAGFLTSTGSCMIRSDNL